MFNGNFHTPYIVEIVSRNGIGCNLWNLFVEPYICFIVKLIKSIREIVSFGQEIFTEENIPLANWIFENVLTTVATGISNYRLILREPTN